MTIPTRRLIPIDGHTLAIQITDDGSRTLIDPESGVAYHSAAGAASETQHVYLNNSGIGARIAESRSASVLEIGFGTGLAMLMTLDAAIVADASLHYSAVEFSLLPAQLLRQLKMERQVRNPPTIERFLDWRSAFGPTAPPGDLVWQVGESRRIVIHHQNACDWVAESNEVESFDAIYFDPFAPNTNPELWQASFLRAMQRMLRDDGKLVTYCVNRAIRQEMEMAGFRARRVPGPQGGKREVMIATKI